jgi:hypothetical protein
MQRWQRRSQLAGQRGDGGEFMKSEDRRPKTEEMHNPLAPLFAKQRGDGGEFMKIKVRSRKLRGDWLLVISDWVEAKS